MTAEPSHLIGADAVQTEAENLAHRIGIRNLTIATAPQGDGSPYIEVRDAYHFVVEERGLELERRETSDLDELLYWIFDGVTFTAASSFELRNRKPKEDSRRLLFARQEELLGQIAEAWACRKADEHRAILAVYPFDDAVD